MSTRTPVTDPEHDRPNRPNRRTSPAMREIDRAIALSEWQEQVTRAHDTGHPNLPARFSFSKASASTPAIGRQTKALRAMLDTLTKESTDN